MFVRHGGVSFDEDDQVSARAIQGTLSVHDIAAPYRIVAMQPRSDEPLCNYIMPLGPGSEKMVGSTDVADVTWAVLTTRVLVATHAIGMPAHSRQITAQGKSPAAPGAGILVGAFQARHATGAGNIPASRYLGE